MGSKQSDDTPGEKLLGLFTLLLCKSQNSLEKRVSISEMCTYLGCSKQTVLRLLAQMEKSRYGKLMGPEKRGREHLYYLDVSSRKNFSITPSEVTVLSMCWHVINNVLPVNVRNLLGKTDTDGTEKAADGTPVGEIYSKGEIDYRNFAEQQSVFLRAMKERRVCELTYRNPLTKQERRLQFAPLRLVSYHESIYVYGWEVKKSSPVEQRYANTLKIYLQRCFNVKLTKRSSADLPDPEAGNGKKWFGIMPGEPFELVALFSQGAASYVYDRKWSDDQRMELLDDGSLRVTLTARSRAEVLAWIQSFGPQAQILSPQSLREEAEASAEKMLALYRAAAPQPAG